MHLIIFDIDGTLLDSVQADDACFIQTFQELHDVDLQGVDWNTYPHVTDAGLTAEIFTRFLNRPPTATEVEAIKSRFKQLLTERTQDFLEIPGALAFLKTLEKHPSVKLGFATGGWKETALLKCQSVGLDLERHLHKTSNDHFDRAAIVRLVMDQARKEAAHDLASVTYFGDGLWDFRTTQTLDIGFVGVDRHASGRLAAAGAEVVLNDFTQADRLLEKMLRG